jgi:mannosyltransferase OCH1-like enzyme
MIPKIIHQMGPSNPNNWHPIWKECQDSWKINFSDFQYVFWNDEDIRNFIEKNYSDILKYYDEFPYNIMRVDISRYLILHSYGGIYADLDIYCYKNFYDDLVNDLYIVESWEDWGEKVQNSLMISNPNNNFWIKCIRCCIEKFICSASKNYTNSTEYILNISGPKLLSEVLGNEVTLLPKQIFNPMIRNQFNWSWGDYSSPEHFNALTDFNEMNKINDGVITRHYLTGKWTT